MNVNADNSITSNQGSETAKGTDSRSSRIMSVRQTSPILAITVFFVFTNIVFGPFINIPLLALLVIFIGIAFHHWKNPGRYPKWLTNYFDQIIRRSGIFPLELVLVVGIVYINIVQIAKPYSDDKWYQLGTYIVVVLAFYLTELGNRASFTGYRGWKIIWELSLKPLISSKKRKEGKSGDETDEALSVDPENEIERITPELLEEMAKSTEPLGEKGYWEEEQKKRWQEWIQEEMHRFDGKGSLDDSQ